jgi:hypothetical protein
VERKCKMPSRARGPFPMNRDFASIGSHLTGCCLLPTFHWQLPGLCTLVDIRWKNAQKVSLCLTFRPARRGLSEAKVNPQAASCQGDPIEHLISRATKTPYGTANPKVSYRFSLIVHYLGRNLADNFGPECRQDSTRAIHPHAVYAHGAPGSTPTRRASEGSGPPRSLSVGPLAGASGWYCFVRNSSVKRSYGW